MGIIKASAKMDARKIPPVKKSKPRTKSAKYGRLPKTDTLYFVTYDKVDGEVAVRKLEFNPQEKTFHLYRVGIVGGNKFIPSKNVIPWDVDQKDIVYFQLKKGAFCLTYCNESDLRCYQNFTRTPQIVKYFTELDDAELFALRFSKPSNREGQKFEEGRWTVLWSFAAWHSNRVFLNKKDVLKRKGKRVCLRS